MALSTPVSIDLHPSSNRQRNCVRRLHFFKQGSLTDVQFLVGQERKLVCGHKIILAMVSEVFEAMFYSPLAEDQQQIPIPDIEPPAFELLFEFIYSDRLVMYSAEQAMDVYYAANKYLIMHAVDICTDYLLHHLTPSNVGAVYEFALLFNNAAVIKKSLDLIKSETTNFLADRTFVDIDISTLLKVFEMKDIAIDCEMELFEALDLYAKKHNLSPRHEQIRQALYCIRFLTVSPAEFTRKVKNAILLTKQEAKQIFAQIKAKHPAMEPTGMPKGFCTIMSPRKPPPGFIYNDINAYGCYMKSALTFKATETIFITGVKLATKSKRQPRRARPSTYPESILVQIINAKNELMGSEYYVNDVCYNSLVTVRPGKYKWLRKDEVYTIRVTYFENGMYPLRKWKRSGVVAERGVNFEYLEPRCFPLDHFPCHDRLIHSFKFLVLKGSS